MGSVGYGNGGRLNELLQRIRQYGHGTMEPPCPSHMQQAGWNQSDGPAFHFQVRRPACFLIDHPDRVLPRMEMQRLVDRAR